LNIILASLSPPPVAVAELWDVRRRYTWVMSLIAQSRRKNAGFDLFELVLLIAVIGIITVLTAVYLTVQVHRRSVAAREQCIENLNMIEASKVQWAFDDPKNEVFFTNRTFMNGHFDPWAAVESNPMKRV
jgi:hypothetical protein